MSEIASSALSSDSADLQVPLARIVQFVRQLSHDLRNHLNAAELQAAYLKEIADDTEIKAEVQRLRAMVSEIGSSLQALTSALAPVKLTLMPYEASAFLEDLQQKVTQQFGEQAAAFKWDIAQTDAMLEIDPQILQLAFVELIDNSLRHARGAGAITVTSSTTATELTVTLREPKTAWEASVADWGREPFKTAKHGHYSLGLHRARNVVEAHCGKLAAEFDRATSLLVTTVSLPISDARS